MFMPPLHQDYGPPGGEQSKRMIDSPAPISGGGRGGNYLMGIECNICTCSTVQYKLISTVHSSITFLSCYSSKEFREAYRILPSFILSLEQYVR